MTKMEFTTKRRSDLRNRDIVKIKTREFINFLRFRNQNFDFNLADLLENNLNNLEKNYGGFWLGVIRNNKVEINDSREVHSPLISEIFAGNIEVLNIESLPEYGLISFENYSNRLSDLLAQSQDSADYDLRTLIYSRGVLVALYGEENYARNFVTNFAETENGVTSCPNIPNDIGYLGFAFAVSETMRDEGRARYIGLYIKENS